MKSTQVLPNDPGGIAAAVAALRRGELVALPTETVYGLAGLAEDTDAVARIFAAKARPLFDPLIVHVSSAVRDVEGLHARGIVDADALDAAARRTADGLMRAFWPGPLTLLLPKGPKVADLVTSGLPAVAVRQPAHPVFDAVATGLGMPIVAPSANPFGRLSPTRAEHVVAGLDGRVPYVLDGGPCAVGVESTIVEVGPGGALRIMRAGGLALEELARATGAPLAVASRDAPVMAPGMTKAHYSPGKPTLMHDMPGLAERLRRLRAIGFLQTGADAAVIDGLRRALPAAAWQVAVLDADAAGVAAARELFAALHAFDAAAVEAIVVERPRVATGLWPAIAERLERACAAWEEPGGV